MTDTEYRIQPEAYKDPGESMPVAPDFYDMCAVRWSPNEPISANEYVRPQIANGFAYQASGAGLTGSNEPRWPKTLGATVTDGSVTWTAVAAGTNALNAISSPSATVEPSGGMTVTSVSVSESRKILATYVGGTDGQDYEVIYQFTLNGVTRIARHVVRVRRQ